MTAYSDFMLSGIFWIIAGSFSIAAAALFALFYLLFHPEKAEIIAAWFAGLVRYAWRRADRAAVAFAVQGEVNSARSRLLETCPSDLFEGKLKLRWADVADPHATLRDEQVVVLMQDAGSKETNVARALMAYLPRAIAPRARRYVDATTMHAADLVLAKSILSDRKMVRGAIDAFFEEHLDPARAANNELSEKLSALDRIDLHGWLTRVLLAEYRMLGNDLHPGEPDTVFTEDADAFMHWLHAVANDRPIGSKCQLDYRGPYFRVSVMFVAMAGKLQLHGIEPYRKRAKRLIYQDRVNALYLMARDASIEAARSVARSLGSDALVASADEFVYSLRSDFRARVVNREKAVCVCLRRRLADIEAGVEETTIDEHDDIEHDVFEFTPAGSTDARVVSDEPTPSV